MTDEHKEVHHFGMHAEQKNPKTHYLSDNNQKTYGRTHANSNTRSESEISYTIIQSITEVIKVEWQTSTKPPRNP